MLRNGSALTAYKDKFIFGGANHGGTIVDPPRQGLNSTWALGAPCIRVRIESFRWAEAHTYPCIRTSLQI